MKGWRMERVTVLGAEYDAYFSNDGILKVLVGEIVGHRHVSCSRVDMRPPQRGDEERVKRVFFPERSYVRRVAQSKSVSQFVLPLGDVPEGWEPNLSETVS